ncbi:MAG TPA: D-alanyl-D-alanine carboxypeptidase/D-alanyl-D-alanine-endopeptidase [Terriglobales bacterium]|nr:D-alanyl-D-alanine carboxypeptidase/D-alanyl-D-alanine-endopeptidase [Terriglobales bacterium]
MKRAHWVGIVILAMAAAAAAQSSFAERVAAVLARPLFRHATFGIELYSLDRNEPLFRLNADQLFTPASTTKLLTEGSALALLGPQFRFHTRVFAAGTIKKGELRGDLVLVASGDPDLSSRLRPDGTLAFENEDHAYDGSPYTRAVPGDPLMVLAELAHQVAARGVRKIKGRVLVDVNLFPEGERELGTGTVISPICVNDNIVDVTIGPGAAPGAPVTIHVSPATAYARFVNSAVTGAPNSKPSIRWAADQREADGSHVISIGGSFPQGTAPILYAYAVPEPSRFAEMALEQELRAAGIALAPPKKPQAPDWPALERWYTPGHQVAEHVSPPFYEDVKVTLKVSQNLHASMMPWVVGATLSHAGANAEQAGFDLERSFLEKAGLDLSAASQGDGAGGAQSAFFTPDFMVHYLAFIARQPDFSLFYRALPILGRDGTLWNIQVLSPAAGHVHAKTGTFAAYDALNRNLMVTGKGLAGYMTTLSGHHLAFALYANRVSVPMDGPDPAEIVGQALGEIADAAYEVE